MRITPVTRGELLHELAVLFKRQVDAMEHASDFHTTPEETDEYDRRSERMSEIYALLSKLSNVFVQMSSTR